MGLEADAQKDLELDTEDAENVVGGKKTTAKKAVSNPKVDVGHSLPPIIAPGATNPVPYVQSDDCDPDATTTDSSTPA
jgi:hypothetical protein